jgi:hypothetical protein
MKLPKKSIILLILLVICFLIHFYSADPARVEQGYSAQLSPVISKSLRFIFGWAGFSIGDILYGFFVGWIFWKLWKGIRNLWGKQPSGQNRQGKQRLFSILVFCTSVYIVFNVFWGINYNRQGIATQLGLSMEKYDKEDLREMNCILIDKVNESKRVLIRNKTAYPTSRELFRRVSNAYRDVSKTYPFLSCEPASIKSSMWGWLGNYTGFTGYYNPFTGEAQVNTTVPEFLQPFITSHEMGHQVGYAKEMEANFVGYLASAASTDTLLHYSCYLDLFMYSNRNLFILDSNSARLYANDLSPDVKKDLAEWSRFNKKHRSFAEPLIRWAYGIYLRGNKQPQGVLSYDEVTAFIISYYKKFGRV